MKKLRLLLAAMTVPLAIGTVSGTIMAESGDDGSEQTEIAIDEKHFPDAVFREYVKQFDKDKNGSFSRQELDVVYEINCPKMNILKLDGIEYFTSVERLYCEDNALRKLDVSKNTSLFELHCNANGLKVLDVSMLPDLFDLDCSGNELAELDVSRNKYLSKLYCGFNRLSEIDTSSCPMLLELSLTDNADLTKVDVSHNPGLDFLHCAYTKVSEIVFGDDMHLRIMNCDEAPLKKLDLSQVNLKELHCIACGLDELDLTGQTNLTDLVAFANNIKELDLSKNTKLEYCNVNMNLLTELDVTDCKDLFWLDVRFNYMKEHPKGAPERGLDFEPQKYVGPVEGLKAEPSDLLPIRLSWNDVKEAEAFEVYRSESENGKYTCIGEAVDLMYEDTTALPNKTYYYKVKGYRTMKEYSGKFYGEFSSILKVDPRGSVDAPKDPENPGFESFVERLYTVALDRESDPEGKAYWVRRVVEEGASGADCARFFLLGSDEFLGRNLSVDDFVEILYDTFFDRVSDEAGKKGWVDAIRSGAKSRKDVVNDFIESTEWCNVCASFGVKSGAQYHKATKPSENAKNFATRLYTCCLKRDAEADGLRYWALALTNLEQTGAAAAKEFFESEEFVGFNTTDQEYITRLYTTFMGRNPGGNEVAYWTGEIAGGRQSRHSILAFFAQSEEFTKICKQYGIERGQI